jgi:hypothetical protein
MNYFFVLVDSASDVHLLDLSLHSHIGGDLDDSVPNISVCDSEIRTSPTPNDLDLNISRFYECCYNLILHLGSYVVKY